VNLAIFYSYFCRSDGKIEAINKVGFDRKVVHDDVNLRQKGFQKNFIKTTHPKKIKLSIRFNNEKQRVVSCMYKHNKYEIN
jgi:hypothetical protein